MRGARSVKTIQSFRGAVFRVFVPRAEMVSGARIMKFLGSDSDQMLHWTNFRQVFRNKHTMKKISRSLEYQGMLLFSSLHQPVASQAMQISCHPKILPTWNMYFHFWHHFESFSLVWRTPLCAELQYESCSSHNILSAEITVNLHHLSRFTDNRKEKTVV